MSRLIGRTSHGTLGFVHDGAVVSTDNAVVTEIEPTSRVRDDDALPVTVAHRGYSSANPENTLAACAAAMRAGAEFIEIDVRTAADGVPVVMHDQTVDRTTNGTGDVAALSSSHIATIDAGSWYSPAFSGQPVPTLAHMLELMRGSAASMLMELKGPVTSAEVKTTVDVIAEAGLENRIVIQSFDTNALRYAREHAPQIERGLLRGPLDAEPVAVTRDLGVVMYNPLANTLNTRPGIVEELNNAGIAVMPYTVNSAEGWAQLTALGVDGIITDRVGAFIGWKLARAHAREQVGCLAE